MSVPAPVRPYVAAYFPTDSTKSPWAPGWTSSVSPWSRVTPFPVAIDIHPLFRKAQMTPYERVTLTVPGFLMKARGSILAGDFETASITLACSIIPLLAGLAHAPDTRPIEAAARNAMAELALVTRRPLVWNADIEEMRAAHARRPIDLRIDLKALEFVVRRLEDTTSPSDTELVTLIHAVGSILEVNRFESAPLRLVK